MVSCVLELLSVQPQPHQPDPEGEQLVLTVGLAHDGAALGDGLGGDGEAQIDVCSHLVQFALESQIYYFDF